MKHFMNRDKRVISKARKGASVLEVLVASTLLVSMIGVVSTITVGIYKIERGARNYLLATQELANQLEFVGSLGVAERKAALENLTPSVEIQNTLLNPKLQGFLVGDLDGERVVISLDWDRGGVAEPLTMVAWVNDSEQKAQVVQP